MRDRGHVFHVGAFIVPQADETATTTMGDVARAIIKLDWKLQDVAVIAFSDLPENLESQSSAADRSDQK